MANGYEGDAAAPVWAPVSPTAVMRMVEYATPGRSKPFCVVTVGADVHSWGASVLLGDPAAPALRQTVRVAYESRWRRGLRDEAEAVRVALSVLLKASEGAGYDIH